MEFVTIVTTIGQVAIGLLFGGMIGEYLARTLSRANAVKTIANINKLINGKVNHA